MEEAITRHGDRILHRLFTDAEIRYCDAKFNRFERYAARFAAKEAALKAIGTGWRHGVAWTEVEVGREPGGRPTIHLSGKAGEFAARMGARRFHLSLSHTTDLAIAYVILED